MRPGVPHSSCSAGKGGSGFLLLIAILKYLFGGVASRRLLPGPGANQRLCRTDSTQCLFYDRYSPCLELRVFVLRTVRSPRNRCERCERWLPLQDGMSPPDSRRFVSGLGVVAGRHCKAWAVGNSSVILVGNSSVADDETRGPKAHRWSSPPCRKEILVDLPSFSDNL